MPARSPGSVDAYTIVRPSDVPSGPIAFGRISCAAEPSSGDADIDRRPLDSLTYIRRLASHPTIALGVARMPRIDSPCALPPPPSPWPVQMLARTSVRPVAIAVRSAVIVAP